MSNIMKSYVCSYEDCKASFKRIDRLESHMRLHSDVRPYICSHPDCGRSYYQKHHLKRHENTHGNFFRCTEEKCDQVFTTQQNMKKHVNNMHFKKKMKTYKCSHCSEQFNRHSWLKQHEYRHTGIKPYVCPNEDCNKRFLVPSKLKRHLKVHQGYPCTKANCNETFSTWTLFRKHLHVAHPIIYQCDICERQFSKIFNLKAHLEVHGNLNDREVFECPHPDCCRFYFKQSNLTHHIKSYHEKRIFVCKSKNCYRAFKTEEDLTQHYQFKHDPNIRLRKRKKKMKPSLAALLSGCAKKDKRKADEFKMETTIVSSPELSNEKCLKSSRIKHQDEDGVMSYKKETDENKLKMDIAPIECLNISVEESKGDKITNDEERSTTYDVDEGIQALLNMIKERNALNAQSRIPKEAEFVSFKEFIKL